METRRVWRLGTLIAGLMAVALAGALLVARGHIGFGDWPVGASAPDEEALVIADRAPERSVRAPARRTARRAGSENAPFDRTASARRDRASQQSGPRRREGRVNAGLEAPSPGGRGPGSLPPVPQPNQPPAAPGPSQPPSAPGPAEPDAPQGSEPAGPGGPAAAPAVRKGKGKAKHGKADKGEAKHHGAKPGKHGPGKNAESAEPGKNAESAEPGKNAESAEPGKDTKSVESRKAGQDAGPGKHAGSPKSGPGGHGGKH